MSPFLKFYLLGVLVTFSMLMLICLKTRPWKEESWVKDSESLTRRVFLVCIIICALLSLFSWVAAVFFLIKRIDEIRNGID